MSLSVSTGIIMLIGLTAHLLRVVVRRAVTEPQAQRLLREVIAASELCGCCFELAIVADTFGVITYAVYLFLVSIYWSLAWGDANACPYLQVEEWWLGRTRLPTVLLRILAEVAGGWATWRYIRLLWRLELSPAHHDRWLEECSADLQVSPLQGALVEGVAVLLCRLVARSMDDLEPRFAVAIDSLCGTSLVIAGFNYSGGYYNPMLASAMKLGCRGHSVGEHVAVYWGAATVGAVASTYLYPVLRPTLTNRPLKRE
ncbi:aquaporin-11-like [Pollicipes pollicipes]|uniref:aquaporin-11-like n=1 Tax=Pollicipes pollicipes TaxID=41117 RepID=UPI001884C52A|nr:aquaporin-11-like [Pollicipes pollicipes]XP_037085902.1 aquaporin-11-like [Pollicipes pollicipes]XP_037085903.1 aquaporin-11-like [Pollicipes pollicipes]